MLLITGTTHFLNAVVQKRDLVRVTVVRLCGPCSSALPPFVDVEPKLKRIIQGEISPYRL